MPRSRACRAFGLPRAENRPAVVACGVSMEFRLTYDGPLKAATHGNPRSAEKHAIRRALSLQLKELRRTHPRLVRVDRDHAEPGSIYGSGTMMTFGTVEIRAPRVEVFERRGQQFIPLITDRTGVGCALSILFLRRDQPGNVVQSGGDIDNRIKVLFDALRIPASDSEVPSDEPTPEPIYCLLEDDKLITEVQITTDRLLTPSTEDSHLHDVRLVLHVRTVVLQGTNLAAFGF